MRGKKVLVTATILAASLWVALPRATESLELLNRSIYLPVEFQVCEHLGDAVFYQDDALVAKMPAKRIFQFTYYPELDQILPQVVPVRIEGRYLESGEAFVAKLAISPTGVHSAHRTRETDVLRQVEKQKGKIDVRLKEKAILLRCPRFCKRESGEEDVRRDR